MCSFDPEHCNAFTTCSSEEMLAREQMATDAPWAARTLAAAKPMPLDPPVTTATRPSSNDFKVVVPEDFNTPLERTQIEDFVGIKHDIEFGLQGGYQHHVGYGVPGLYAVVLQLLDVDLGTKVQ